MHTILEFVQDQINALRLKTDRQITHNRSFFVRMLSQMLYDAPKLHTGMVSIRLLELKLKKFSTKPCPEHHLSRHKGGKQLIAMIDYAVLSGVDPTHDQIKKIVSSHCQVHYTTSSENSALRRHQRTCSSEAAYRRANIRLVRAPDLFRKRGKHTSVWKRQMLEKYSPVVEQFNNPAHIPIVVYVPVMIH